MIDALIFGFVFAGVCLALVGTMLVAYARHHDRVRPTIHEPPSNIAPHQARPFDFERDA